MREVSLYLSSPFNCFLPSGFDEVKCPEGPVYTGELQKRRKKKYRAAASAVAFSDKKARLQQTHTGLSLDVLPASESHA